MRIFLSYASEDRASADAIRLALQGDGHDVFFDREDLPPGGEFHTRIRHGIEASELVIFLVSPKTLDAGSYTLNEISFAEKKWPTPDGHILPVLLERVPVKDLPVYLRSVTFLETPGNVPAEVAGAVERIARDRRRKKLRWVLPVVVLLIAVAAAVAWYFVKNRGPSTTRVGQDGAPAVLIPEGKFTMGDDELSPIRQLFVGAFYMDRFEVTTARYRKFLESTGPVMPPDYWDAVKSPAMDDYPAIGMTWNEASAYCRWAGRRLPTEAEWEKAARGADARLYPWGSAEPTEKHANFGNGSDEPYEGALTAVGTHEAGKSPFGIDDMSGNASEWVADWFTDEFPSDDVYNPRGPAEGEKKVIRGGGRYDPPKRLTAAARQNAGPDFRSEDVGFRCASDP